jgi:3-oxoacyl-[acyl-carrier protein] reductase
VKVDLQGKVIVITGAAQGLGRKMAELLSSERAKIALIDMDGEKLRETMRASRGPGTMMRDYLADVTNEAQVEALFKSVHGDFGRIDGLISNAGTNSDALLVKVANGKVEKKMSVEEFERVIAVDLKGVFLCGREAAVHMVEAGRSGVIINISSISRAGNIGQSNYAAAKAGVAAMTVTWAKELARHGIRVAGIAPGFSDTRMVARMSPKIREKLLSTIPLRRLALPEEIARAALFILQDDYYNGRILEIDGGLRL